MEYVIYSKTVQRVLIKTRYIFNQTITYEGFPLYQEDRRRY